MHKVERKQILLETLRQKSFFEVRNLLELTAKYNIPAITVRRDLKELEAEGKVELTHGGVRGLLSSDSANEVMRASRLDLNREEKRIIAHKAQHLLDDYDVIFVGPGTTCEEFVKAITKPIKIYTNALHISQIAEQNSNILDCVMIGGKFISKIGAFVGLFTEESLSLIKISKLFISANDIDSEGKIYNNSEEEARVELAVFNKTDKRYVLADSTKLNRIGFYKFAENTQITAIVTEKQIEIKGNVKLIY